MRAFVAAAAAIVAVVLSSQAARAGCRLAEAPSKSLTLESGASASALTAGRTEWQERSFTVVSRAGSRSSVYGRAASDSRFGSTDLSYEAGAYQPLGAHLIGNVEGSFSPTHAFLAGTTESAGLDLRTSGGYGYQAQYAQRNYPAQTAAITTIGADRYAGANHFTLGVTLANLTSVPGTAVSGRIGFARYLACDEESLSVSAGRDVESTGVIGQVAVFKTYTYDVNDVHWFTPRFGLNVGAEWALLTGAYDRFELRLALRERL